MNGKVKLISLVGAACAACLLAIVPRFEGVVPVGYKDPIGIVTACAGHTRTAELGKTYTKQECEELLLSDLLEHAEPVLKCTPGLRGLPNQLAAAVSFAFNVGVSAYCKSTMARKINAGDLLGGCAELSRWTRAGDKVLPGLVTRRAAERKLCETGLK